MTIALLPVFPLQQSIALQSGQLSFHNFKTIRPPHASEKDRSRRLVASSYISKTTKPRGDKLFNILKGHVI